MQKHWINRLRTWIAMIACWLPFTGFAEEPAPVVEELVGEVVSDPEIEREADDQNNGITRKKAKKKAKRKSKKKKTKNSAENKILNPDQSKDRIPGDERTKLHESKLPENENPAEDEGIRENNE